MGALLAVRAIFAPSASIKETDANTQAIVASAARIKERADEFSRMLHGQRGDQAQYGPGKRSKRCAR